MRDECAVSLCLTGTMLMVSLSVRVGWECNSHHTHNTCVMLTLTLTLTITWVCSELVYEIGVRWVPWWVWSESRVWNVKCWLGTSQYQHSLTLSKHSHHAYIMMLTLTLTLTIRWVRLGLGLERHYQTNTLKLTLSKHSHHDANNHTDNNNLSALTLSKHSHCQSTHISL